MQRQTLLRHWDQAWNEGLWHASWSQALENLTPDQAAAHQATGRHSIWQLANHIVFWRRYVINRTRTGTKLSKEEIAAANWTQPAEINEQAWTDAKQAYTQSHHDFRALIADEAIPLEEVEFMPYHDSYHIGQIMQLRAALGLAPIE